MTPTRHDGWAVVTPGFERVAAQELRALGIEPRAAEPGGVPFSATPAELLHANLSLRSVSRVLVRVAEFRARAFHELERLSRAVDWSEFVAPGMQVRLRVTCRKSRLYHSDAVAERVAKAIERAVPAARAAAAGDEGDDDAPADTDTQLFVVRLSHDVCTISADSSGELLHRRGYRLATAKAPIRETTAAGLLLALGWDGTRPLLDPMCGSGTIAIEAALIARNVAPGLGRRFACERWPTMPAGVPAAARVAARRAARDRCAVPLLSSDRDAGAIAAAQANAERAGVTGDIAFRQCALSAVEPPQGPGLVLVNPPYGDRVGDKGALRNLYAQLGNVARAKCAGWTLAFLSADRAFDAQVGLPFRDMLSFRNGGIPVRVVAAEVPSRG
ncbi:MAG: class I SAM-dependent RNA methyltransferase [Gemmatimonadetes bacterium]|nr:class I SAM-dependent RNA methyltransferase [Gemmatimonadota bacterium]